MPSKTVEKNVKSLRSMRSGKGYNPRNYRPL
jgi:hypothetical protein